MLDLIDQLRAVGEATEAATRPTDAAEIVGADVDDESPAFEFASPASTSQPTSQRATQRRLTPFLAAAAIVIVIAVGGIVFANRASSPADDQVAQTVDTVLPPATGDSPVPDAQTEGSPFDVIDASSANQYAGGEKYLVGLLISPESLTAAHQLNVIQIDDPNGNAAIDGRWYEPRLLQDTCSYRTDQAPMPIVVAGYIPGDPSESETSAPFAALGAPYQAGIQIQLFDNAEQRDAFAGVMEQAYLAPNTMDCAAFAVADFGDVELIAPRDSRYPSFAVVTDSALGQTYTFQYEVGTRVLLTATLSNPPDMLSSKLDGGRLLDPLIIDEFVTLQLDRLVAQGLG